MRLFAAIVLCLLTTAPAFAEELSSSDVNRYMRDLESRHQYTRLVAASALGTVRDKKRIENVVWRLVALGLEDESALVRQTSAASIGRLQPKLTHHLRQRLVLVICRDPNDFVARQAARTLESLDPKGSTAAELLASHRPTVEALPAEAVKPAWYWQIKYEKRVAELVQELTHKNGERRLHAAAGLADIGPPAIKAGPALIKALDDEHTMVQFYALQAIEKIRPRLSTKGQSVLSRIVWKTPELFVRQQAARALTATEIWRGDVDRDLRRFWYPKPKHDE